MSINSYKCDRCGNVFTAGGLGFQYYPVVEDTRMARVTKYGHFCTECRDGFFKYLDQERSE